MAAPWDVVFYRDARGRAPVERFIEGLPSKLQARLLRTINLLAEHGTELTAPLAEKVTGERFWELRIRQGTNIVRVFYFAATRRRMVLLHAFIKKSQRAPRREIETARARYDEYRSRVT
jgi:phage-related protein